MPRPLKEGMDYFPHDTDAADDEKVVVLEAMFGNDGYAFYFKTLERIYRTSDAHLDLSLPGAFEVHAMKLRVAIPLLREMIKVACGWGLFDKTVYEKTQRLTSNGVQKRVEIVADARRQRRERYELEKQKKEFGDDEPAFGDDKQATNTCQTPDKHPPNGGLSLRAKGKERKGKEIEEGNSDDSSSAAPLAAPDPPTQKPPKPSRETLQQQLDTIREPLPDEDLGLIDEYLDLLATENKSGKMGVGRRLNVTRELLELRDGGGQVVGLGVQPWRYGMSAAIQNSAPALNYIKKAAASWQPTSYAGSRGGEPAPYDRGVAEVADFSKVQTGEVDTDELMRRSRPQ